MDITFGVPVPEEDEGQPAPEPIVRSPRLTIRAFRPSDAAALQRQADDADVSHTLSDHFPFPYTMADAEQYLKIARPEDGDYAIFRRSDAGGDDVFVGGIKLKRLPDVYARGAEVGYWIGREHWGRGLASEAVVAFCKFFSFSSYKLNTLIDIPKGTNKNHIAARWAFESHPDVHRLESLVYANNPASSRVLEKAGFTHEGTRRRAACKRGEIIDVRVYGLLRDEYEDNTKAV